MENEELLDKEKFSATVADMKTLTSDFSYVDTPEVKKLLAERIIEKAKELVKLADTRTPILTHNGFSWKEVESENFWKKTTPI